MQYALVAGGSKGIGFALAEALAKRKFNLVLIARHEETLQEAKQSLQHKYSIAVETLCYDLSIAESADKIAKWFIERDLSLNMLCNVAGIGGDEDFLSASLSEMRYMIHLNIEYQMALTMQLLPLLKKNTPSYILNVSSMAGFAPMPLKNLYASTKSSLIFFSYALKYQLKNDNIKVSCLCPGPVFTKPEIEEETMKRLGWLGNAMAILPQRVGEIAIKQTLNGKLLIVPGIVSKLMSILLRILSRRMATWIYYRLGK